MFVLNEQQVEFILDDIRRNGIEREELQLDLLDHICCVIENEMQPGHDFMDFYRQILPRFFKRKLGEIQEETDLLLTFKHYYTMKKIMLISGTFAAIGVVAGAVFKVMRWPGASPLFLLSVFALSFIFLPVLFLIKSREVKAKRERITLGIATFFGILMSVAILFRVLHWPGAAPMGLASLCVLFFLFLPVYFFGGIRNPETKMNTIISSVLILFGGGLLLLLTSLRPSQQMYAVYVSSISESSRLCDFATQQNALKYAADASDSTKSQAALLQLRQSCDGLCAKIEAAKEELLKAASPEQDPKANFEMVLSDNMGNFDFPTSMLFNGSTGEPKPALTGIKSDLENLRTLLKEKFHRADLPVLNTDDVAYSGNGMEGKTSWEKAKFFHVPFELVMLNLNQLELEVRMAERECL